MIHCALLLFVLLLGCSDKRDETEVSLLVINNGLYTYSTHDYGINFKTSKTSDRQLFYTNISERSNLNQQDPKRLSSKPFNGLSVRMFSELNSTDAADLAVYVYLIEVSEKTKDNLFIMFTNENSSDKEFDKHDFRFLPNDINILPREGGYVSFRKFFSLQYGRYLFLTSEALEAVQVWSIQESTNDEINKIINSIEETLKQLNVTDRTDTVRDSQIDIGK